MSDEQRRWHDRHCYIYQYIFWIADLFCVVGWLPAVSDADAIGPSQSRDAIPGHRLVGHVPQQRRADLDLIG